MTTNSTKKHEFQAEVQQLLEIVVHSLYTDREIFVRELVSNAADALEKIRHIQLTEKEIYDVDLNLEINITTDDTAGTITIQDFGIGMTRDELVENLGTIAHSGSKAFLRAFKEGAESNHNLIGQFGVGFYSVFMVGSEVKVYTHSWHEGDEHLLWTSDGTGSYEIETVEGQRRGTKIVLQLKEDAKEFGGADRVRQILNHYSSFIQFPVNLNGDRINTIQALWARNKNEIKDEEYTEFYKFQAKAIDEPRSYLHFNADAPLAINALLFIPKENLERLGLFRAEIGVSLYCRKVLIDDKPDGLLPEWLRFLRGVVDSADLPLNISRETMQDSALVQKLNRVLTRRFLKHLEELSKKKPDDYHEFYGQFGIFLKEGITSDFTYRTQLGGLLRYESSLTDAGKTTGLADYVSRLQEDQKEIYYLHAPSRQSIEEGPYLEAFKTRNLEVLYLYEPIDEFAMNHLGEFSEKKLVSADQADVDLADTIEGAEEPLSGDDETTLCSWLKNTLGDRVERVTGSNRLVDNPAIVLNADKFMTPAMRRIMKSMRQDVPDELNVNLELNTRHPLIKNLASLKDHDAALSVLVAEQIFDNAMIAAGYHEDPRNMVKRVYQILERVSSVPVSKPPVES